MKNILFISENKKRYETIINDIVQSNHNLKVIESFNNNTLGNIDFANYSLVIIDYNEKIGKCLDYVSYYKLNNNYTNYLILVNVVIKIKNIEEYEMVLKEEMILKHKALLDKMYALGDEETCEEYLLDDGKKNVVLIDDDIISLEILRGILEGDNIKTTLCSDSITAFYDIKNMIIDKINIDLLIIDLNMPVLSGYKLIELIRQDDMTNNIPIMVVSSNNVRSSVKEVIKYNIVEYIVKPFNKELLLQRVNNILGI